MTQSLGISAVVPVYGRSETLSACLSSAAIALSETGLPTEIVVVDDGGDEPEMGPVTNVDGIDLTWVRMRRNSGFGAACNEGVSAARYPLVMLLNSDVFLHTSAVSILAASITRSDFSVTPHISIGSEDGPCESLSYLFVHRGRLGLGHLGMTQDSLIPETSCEVAYGCGAACLLWRDRFLGLGGFSPLFLPFYWEDADLGWRAWKRGWASRFVPSARAVHRHGATIGDGGRVRAIREGHRLLFMLADLRSPTLRRRLIAWAPLRVAADVLRRRTPLAALSVVWRSRERVRRHRQALLAQPEVLADEQVLALFEQMASAGERGRL